MTHDVRCVLRDSTPADLHRGSRSLLQLLDGMSEQNLRGCRLEAVGDRPDMMMTRADGLETPGWGWPVMEIVGAVVFLHNLNLAPVARTLTPPGGNTRFIMDGSWGMLPPGVHAVQCTCTIRPKSEYRADLRVLSEEQARAAAAEANLIGRTGT